MLYCSPFKWSVDKSQVKKKRRGIRREQPNSVSQRWYRRDSLTTEKGKSATLAENSCILWEKGTVRDVKSLKTFISNVELVEHVTRVRHTHTHTGASSFIARQWSLFLDCLHTHTLKTKTAGLKMGPCHSPLGVNLLCPQSCFSLSHFSPFLCVLIARWIWSSHHLVVFRRI